MITIKPFFAGEPVLLSLQRKKRKSELTVMLKSSCLFNKVRGNSSNQTEDVSLTFSTKIRSGLNVALLADRLTLVITLAFFCHQDPIWLIHLRMVLVNTNFRPPDTEGGPKSE